MWLNEDDWNYPPTPVQSKQRINISPGLSSLQFLYGGERSNKPGVFTWGYCYAPSVCRPKQASTLGLTTSSQRLSHWLLHFDQQDTSTGKNYNHSYSSPTVFRGGSAAKVLASFVSLPVFSFLLGVTLLNEYIYLRLPCYDYSQVRISCCQKDIGWVLSLQGPIIVRHLSLILAQKEGQGGDVRFLDRQGGKSLSQSQSTCLLC